MSEPRSRTLLWILIGGGAFFLFVLAVFSLVYLTLHAGSNELSFGGFGDRIGVVDLDGVILSPQPVVGELKKFADDSSIKAIILHVNSPGRSGRVGGDTARSNESARKKRRRLWCRLKPWERAGLLHRIGVEQNLCDNGSVVGSIGVISRVGELRRTDEMGPSSKASVFKTGEFKTRAIRRGI